jgi:hypothetical protein
MIIIYSEARGNFLGEHEWVHTTLSAKSFRTSDEARAEVKRRTPKGKTESIALLEFKCREIVGLNEMFTPASRRHYNKVMTED